ncbi:alpha/beta fold hydrolase [Oscillatoria sp. CS-180]|uniref:alpha/beta hydrolase n=1 Tax=Oscillatoria sp. CS-180 TaxID=3021720 RepID=UPI00232D5CFD|nr:alpha/beta hydrolase [Oscillatoria sp. CS-180]MDB9525191.1 alpha/beta fold hydrolase [Oscillatoria sp. CS-180]
MRVSHSIKRFAHNWIKRFSVAVLTGGTLVSVATSAKAVETVTIELGPAETEIHVSDLESFAQTGQVPTRLKLYRSFLTPMLQQTLYNPLDVEPTIRDRFLQDLIGTENGRPLVNMLSEIAPSLTPEAIQTAIGEVEAGANGVTAISLLQALPGETLSLNGAALLRVLSQLGLSHLEQTALSKVLYQELREKSPVPFSGRFEPSIPGNRRVEQWSVSFRDHERDRVIPIDLYWTEFNPGPTVILSHGFGADRHFLDYLARHLASHGLTVVALEHPGSNVDALVKEEGALLPPHEFVQRPQDVSFILNRLEDLNRHSFFLKGRLKMDKITLVGHSLGGYTGLVLAGGKVNPVAVANFCNGLAIGASSPADWFQCAAADAELPPHSLADSRITQLVLMNPLAGHIFGDKGLRQVKIPTLVITSTKDGIASISDQQLRPFNQLTGPRSLVAIIGGTHLSVGDPQNINPALTQVPFMPEHPEEETLPLRHYLNGTVLSFVMQQTHEAKQYRPFLSSDYAQLFSTDQLPIRYSDRLPKSVDRWLANRDRLTHRFTPTFKSIASLLHLEFIDAQHRVANLRRDTLERLPVRPTDVANRLAPRAPKTYRTAEGQSNRESSRPAE